MHSIDSPAPEKADSDILTGKYVENTTHISKCLSCGANLIFNPKTQSLLCEYCGNEQPVNNKEKSQELNFASLLNKNNWSDETHIYDCNNCGAKEVVAKTDIAIECRFCGTTNIIETNELSGLKPNAIVPFKITKEQASEIALKWIKKRKFAPNYFRTSVQPQGINGVYNPAFTFDADTVTPYKGVLAIVKFKTVRVNGKNVVKSYEETFRISGNYSKKFDDILIQASSVISQSDIDNLKSFDTNNSRKYSKEYLHGYSAVQYSKDGDKCWVEAKGIINSKIKQGILSQYTYTRVVSLQLDTSILGASYKYILLPIYVGHCNWKTKLYNFFVSGYNGIITGKTPVSAAKVSVVVGITLLLILGLGAAAYFLGYLQ